MANGLNALREASGLRDEAKDFQRTQPRAGFAAPGLAFAAGQNVGAARKLEEGARQEIIDYQARLEDERGKKVSQQEQSNKLKILGDIFDQTENVYKTTRNPKIASDFFNAESKKAGVNFGHLGDVRFNSDGSRTVMNFGRINKGGDIEFKKATFDKTGAWRISTGEFDKDGIEQFKTATTQDLKGFVNEDQFKLMTSAIRAQREGGKQASTAVKTKVSNIKSRIDKRSTEANALRTRRSTLISKLTGFPESGKEDLVEQIDTQLDGINNEIKELNEQLGKTTGTSVPSGLATQAPQPAQRKSLSQIFEEKALQTQ